MLQGRSLKKAVEANDIEDIKIRWGSNTGILSISSVYQEAQQAQVSAAGSGEHLGFSAQRCERSK